MNLQDLSDEALDGLRIEVLTEQERRVVLATAADQIAALQDAYERATMHDERDLESVPSRWRAEVEQLLNVTD